MDQQLPPWAQRVKDLHDGGVRRVFCLHFNVHDYLPSGVPGKVGQDDMRIDNWIFQSLLSEFDAVVYYDPASDFVFRNDNTSKQLFDEQLRAFPDPSKMTTNDYLKVVEKAIQAHQGKRIAFVIGYADCVFVDEQGGNLEQKKINIRLSSWARDDIRSDCMVILLAENQAKIAQMLKQDSSEIEFIQVPLPDIESRTGFLERSSVPDGSESVGQFAAHSGGLSLCGIKKIIREATAAKVPVTADRIWEVKTQLLSQATSGLLSIIQPRWTADCVGGLNEARQALKPLIEDVRNGNVLAVPMGILFMGPPGTGKSLLAEVLAGELGYPMVELGQVRSKWVGESEQNMALILEYLENLAPAVIFEDEFDQSETQRSSVQGLDSGVSERMLAMKMRFMARPDLRGKIIWIGATNRPDLIDSAFLRPGRFDLRISFMPPINAEERKLIYQAMFHMMAKLYPPFKVEISEEELAVIAELSTYRHPNGMIHINADDPFAPAIKAYTGAEISLICHRGWQLSKDGVLRSADIQSALDDFLPDRSPDYVEMIRMSLAYTNFASTLPAEYRKLILPEEK